MKSSMPLRMCFILVVCFATLITQNVLCHCKCCRDVGCGQRSYLRCNMVQNKLPTLPQVRNLWATQVGRPSRPSVGKMCFQILWKARHGGRGLESGIEPEWAHSPTWIMATVQKVSPLVFQSKSVATIFLSLCLKKITALVIPQAPRAKN